MSLTFCFSAADWLEKENLAHSEKRKFAGCNRIIDEVCRIKTRTHMLHIQTISSYRDWSLRSKHRTGKSSV